MIHDTKKSSGRMSIVRHIILVLLILAMTFGGVSAYLSFSAPNALINKLDAADHPGITVDGENKVTVRDPGYAVYLRAAVVVNWKSETTNNILAKNPSESEYTLTPGDGWAKHTDGFYYYTKPVSSNLTTNPVVTLNLNVGTESPTGYELVANVAVQTIQALGTTDEGDKPAVTDAWGIKVDSTTKELIIETP